MKVALVYPEVYDLARYKNRRKEFPPFGILYLAAYLEINNFDVEIIKINESNMRCNFKDFDVIGFSIPSSVTYGIVKESRYTSVYSGKRTILVGGVHPSFYPKETLFDFKADIVVIGNGEKTILEILQSLKNGNNLSLIKGVCLKNGDRVMITPEREIEKSLDWLPFPARHLLDESDFIMNNRLAGSDVRMTHVMLSRGCPFFCRFCAVRQKKVQFRSGENIRSELEHLVQNYNIKGFAIVDDNFVVNKNIVLSVCQSIKDLGLKWSALLRVDTVDYELLQNMHDAGCIELKFGIESGSESLLRAMGKNISGNQIRNAITLAKSVGIGVKIFLVHGFPGENLATTRETILILNEIMPLVERVSLFRFVPLPGSYVYNNPDLFNLRLSEVNSEWERFSIYRNNFHWWGDKKDFQEVEQSYFELKKFISENWPDDY